MKITGWILLVLAVALFWFGWFLNTQTPIQQPLPVVGLVLGGIALGFLAAGYLTWR